MKQIILGILVVVCCQPLLKAQTVAATDSIEIADKIAEWNTAWSTKDVALACKWYAEDADFTNAFGFHRIGQTEIQTYLTRVFGMDFVMAGNTVQTSLKLKPLSESAVLAISTVERKGQKLSDNSELGTRQTTHYRVFEKTDTWRITAHLISDARSTAAAKH